MKKCIRYKGNTNNTSAIIFLKSKVKNSQWWYFVWENLRGGFCCSSFHFCIFILFLYLHFIFDLHFVVVLHWSFFLIHIFFSQSSLTYPLTIARFSHSFYIFSPAHCRVICDTFIFNHFVIFLPRALRFWVSIFYPQVFFTLRSFTDILPAFIKVFLRAGSSSFKFAGLHIDSENTDSAHLFVWFTVIHNFHIQNDSVLNSTKCYHELLVVKTLVYMILNCFELFSLVQSHM